MWKPWGRGLASQLTVDSCRMGVVESVRTVELASVGRPIEGGL